MIYICHVVWASPLSIESTCVLIVVFCVWLFGEMLLCWQGADTDSFLFSHFFFFFLSWASSLVFQQKPRPCIRVMFTCFSLVTCSPQPFVQLCGSRRAYCRAPGRDDSKVLLNRRAGISFQSADLPVTGLSLQLSATSTTAAIMQNNLISHLLASPTSADCPTRSPSPH